jgi:death-on-curing protein
MVVKLTVEVIYELQELVRQLYGGIEGVKDPGMVEYIAEKPYLVVFSDEQYPALLQQAAVLFVGYAKAHAFNDANKRTGFATCALFLELNGYSIEASSDEIISVALRISDRFSDNPMDVEEVTDWLAQVVTYSSDT